MLNPQYSHFDPDDAEKLSDARYKWGPSEVVEEVEELARRGFKSRMRFYHNIDIVGTPQYNRHAELLAELEKMIKDRLLNRESSLLEERKIHLLVTDTSPPKIGGMQTLILTKIYSLLRHNRKVRFRILLCLNPQKRLTIRNL